jgi:hypothetical protein
MSLVTHVCRDMIGVSEMQYQPLFPVRHTVRRLIHYSQKNQAITLQLG